MNSRKSPFRPRRPLTAHSLLVLVAGLSLSLAGCGDEEGSSGTRSYEFVDEVTAPVAGALTGRPGAAIDPALGTIFVQDTGDGRVFQVDDSGETAQYVASSNRRGIFDGIVVDRGHVILIQEGQLAFYAPDGEFIARRPLRDGNTTLPAIRIRPGAAPGLLVVDVARESPGLFDATGQLISWLPTGLLLPFVVDGAGFIITLEGTRPGTMRVLNTAGQLIQSWDFDGQFRAMAMTSENLVALLLESGAGFIVDYRRVDGTLVRRENLGHQSFAGTPSGLAVGPDNTLLITGVTPEVAILRGGQRIGTFGYRLGSRPGDVVADRVAGRPNGGMAVLDRNGALHRYSELGHYQGMTPLTDGTTPITDLAIDGTNVIHFLDDLYTITQVLPDDFSTRITVDLDNEIGGLAGSVNATSLGLDNSGREIVAGREFARLWITRLSPELGPVRAHFIDLPPTDPMINSPQSIRRILSLSDSRILAISSSDVYLFTPHFELIKRIPAERFARQFRNGPAPYRFVLDPLGLELLSVVPFGSSIQVQRYSPEGDYLGLIPIDSDGIEGLGPDPIRDVRTNDEGYLFILNHHSRVFRFRPING